MNGIDKITEKIISSALSVASEIIKTANEDAQNVLDRYNAEALEQKNNIARQSKQTGNDVIKHHDDLARLECRKQILVAKQSVLDDIFMEAFDKIRKLDRDEYIEFLSNMAAKYSINGTDEMIFSEFDKKSFGDEIVNKTNYLLEKSGKISSIVMSEEVRDIDGGFILKSGSIENNCTFKVLYDIARKELTTPIANILF